MSLNYVRLKNFRKFSDTGEIHLKPLTFLVGANSTGKSSFLKFFPLLKQSADIGKYGAMLWNNDAGVDFGDFRSTVKDGKSFMEFEFGLQGAINKFESPRFPTKNLPEFKINVKIENDSQHPFGKIQEFKISFLNHSIGFQEVSGETTIFIDGKPEDIDEIKRLNTKTFLPSILFGKNNKLFEYSSRSLMRARRRARLNEGTEAEEFIKNFRTLVFEEDNVLLQHLGVGEEIPKLSLRRIIKLYYYYHLSFIIDVVNLTISNWVKNLKYIQPVRAYPLRYYRNTNYASDEIAPDGSNLPMYLNSLSKEAIEKFQGWTERLFGFKAFINGSQGHLQIMVNEKKSNLNRNIIDLGFGYSQLLPVITTIWKTLFIDINKPDQDPIMSDGEQIITIEQPELHLHPRMIRQFARMLGTIIGQLKNSDKKLKIIIETHSSVLIDEIGEIISQGILISNEDVSVLLFDAKQEGMDKVISEGKFSEDGYLTNWPYGFLN